MPNTKINIINQVLNELGRLAVTSETDAQDSLLISQKLDYLLPVALLWTDWNFAIKYRTDSNPITQNFSPDYAYTYQLPADYGRMDRFSQPPIQFRLLSGYLLTNNLPVTYYYVVNDVDYSVMTPLFQRALTLYCASLICAALTQNEVLTQYLNQKFIETQGEAIAQNDTERQINAPPNDFDRTTYV